MKPKNIILVGIIVVLLLLIGRQLLAPKSSSPTQTNSTTTPITKGTTTLYKGTSPCADCPGIATDLTLQRAGEFDGYGTFTLKETYLERSVAPLETAGKWTTDRGSAVDPDASVIVLNFDKPSEAQYFLQVDPKTLRFLDTEKKEVPPPYNYDLKTE